MRIKYFLFVIVTLFTFTISATSSAAAQTSNSTENNEHNTTTEALFENLIIEKLTTTTLSATSIQLSWSQIDSATNYEVYQSTHSDGEFKLIDIVSATDYTIQNIIPGATNYFKVRAVKEVDNTKIYSQYSTVIHTKTAFNTPSNLKVTSKTYNSISLSWSKVDGAEGYEIWMATSKDGKYTKVNTTKATSFKHSNLTTNKTYYYKIRAYTGNKPIYSSYSTIASTKISFASPTNLKVTSKTYNSISLSWSKVDGAEGYEIWMATSKDGKYTKVNTTKATSFKHSNLTTNKTYYYKIRAYTGNKPIFSSYSTIANTKISFATPTNLKVTNTTYNSISLSWSKVDGAKGYEIWMATSKNGKYAKVNTTTTTSFKHMNLTANKTYYYKIRAYTGNKPIYSSYTSIKSAKTTLITPSNFKVASQNYNSITLSWNKVTGVKGYEIWMATSKDGKYTKIKTTTATSYKHTKLTTNKNYYYKVRSYVTNNKKTHYSAFSKVMNGKASLSKVTSLKATGTDTSIKLSWKTVSGATSYKVYRSTSKNGKYTLLTTTKNASYTDKKVTKEKTYYYKLVATRTVGKNVYNSADSAIVSGITILRPNLSVWTSDETFYPIDNHVIYIENHGSKPVRIKSTGAIIDADFESYDRLLQLIDIDTYEDLEWHQIGSNNYDFVGYRVIDSGTWYDNRTTICFEFTYDGVDYLGFVSNATGFTYIKD